MSYSGNCSTGSDEAAVAKTTCMDGFGRTYTVKDPAATTSYGYDSLGNLIIVSLAATTTTGISATTYSGRSFTYSSLGRLISASNPESGQTSYAYWPGGNLHTKTNANNLTTTYLYNAIDQTTDKQYSDNVITVINSTSQCTGTPAVTGGYATPCVTTPTTNHG